MAVVPFGVPGEPRRETAAWRPPGGGTRRFRFGATAVPDPDPPLGPGTVIGAAEQYRIADFLGQGGMGRVYSAVRVRDGRKMALKVLRQDKIPDDVAGEYHARFRQETAAASAVGHPGIIEMYDFEQTPAGEVLLSMELLRGESLEDWLDAAGRLSVGLNLLAGFAEALDAAHRSQIVHRDIKPANLFIQHRDDGSIQPKILDFGLAKMAAPNRTQIETAAGTVLGTPYYLAPERALGKPLTPAADLYSLGVILYEMLTGQLPFDADNFMDILALHIRKEPLDPRQAVPDRVVPDGVARLTMELLSKEPDGRPGSAADVAARIRQLLQTEAEVIGAYTTGPRGQASPEAATMHLRGAPEPNATHDAATVAPSSDQSAAVTAQAATVAPGPEHALALSDAATMVPGVVPNETRSGETEPVGPMMGFASGEVQKTKLETSYGKDATRARGARRGTPLWWLPVGAGLGVAAVVAWTFMTQPESSGPAEPPERSPAADAVPTSATPTAPAPRGPAPPRVAPEPAPVVAAPEAAASPPADGEAEIAAEAEIPEDEPAARPGGRQGSGKGKKGVRRRKKGDAPPKPVAEAPQPPPPEPPPPPKVERDPKNWRVDG